MGRFKPGSVPRWDAFSSPGAHRHLQPPPRPVGKPLLKATGPDPAGPENLHGLHRQYTIGPSAVGHHFLVGRLRTGYSSTGWVAGRWMPASGRACWITHPFWKGLSKR
jgi:hypothetical protein